METSLLLPCLSNVALMVARVMLRHGYEPEMGLGKDSHRNVDVVDIRGNRTNMGWGMNPGNREEGLHRQDSGQIGHGLAMLASVSQVSG